MKEVKVIELSGRAKGKARLGRVNYKNTWFFAKEAVNICDMVWQIGEAYRRNGKVKRFKYPAELTKYFYFLYLTGSRLNEPLLGNPKIQFVHRNPVGGKVGASYINITKTNEKHFLQKVPLSDKDPGFDSMGRRRRKPLDLEKSKRDVNYMTLPILCESEFLMWKLITEEGDNLNVENIFKFKQWGKLYDARLSRFISRNFKTDLRDDRDILHKNTGITPHILRHMRAYNVLINHSIPDKIAMNWFAWSDQKMLYYYAHIKAQLKFKGQIELLDQNNILNDKYILNPKLIEGKYQFATS
jgi:integrase